MDLSPLTRILPILGLLVFISATELVVPLRNQQRNAHGRLTTNLGLTALTLLLGIFFNALMLGGAVYVNSKGFGLLPALHLFGIAALLVTVAALDLSTYLVHVLLHKAAWAWRVHLVHHIDVAIDATTALRQHPLEGLLRFGFVAGAAWGLGASPEAIAVYRLLSGANAIIEHGNISLPRWLDRTLVWMWVTPDMHKIHHSRLRSQTDSNYGNLLSFYDRIFRTFRSSEGTASIRYGIEGRDRSTDQSLRSVMAMPFRTIDRESERPTSP